jgi:hypothetical protein
MQEISFFNESGHNFQNLSLKKRMFHTRRDRVRGNRQPQSPRSPRDPLPLFGADLMHDNVLYQGCGERREAFCKAGDYSQSASLAGTARLDTRPRRSACLLSSLAGCSRSRDLTYWPFSRHVTKVTFTKHLLLKFECLGNCLAHGGLGGIPEARDHIIISCSRVIEAAELIECDPLV